MIEKLHRLGGNWSGRELVLDGFDQHEPVSSHEMAARRKRRVLASA